MLPSRFACGPPTISTRCEHSIDDLLHGFIEAAHAFHPRLPLNLENLRIAGPGAFPQTVRHRVRDVAWDVLCNRRGYNLTCRVEQQGMPKILARQQVAFFACTLRNRLS